MVLNILARAPSRDRPRLQIGVACCLFLLTACTPDPDAATESHASPPASDRPVSSSLFARVGPVLRPAPEPMLVLELEGPPLPSPLRTILFFGEGLGEIPWMERAVQE